MRRAERRPATELADRPLAGGRRDDRDRQRGRVVERRQQPGDRPREERLADARRSGEQQPVAAGQRDLERRAAPRAWPRTSARSGHRHVRRALGRPDSGPSAPPGPRSSPAASRPAPRRRVGGRGPRAAASARVVDADDLDAVDEPRLVDRGVGDDDPPHPRRASAATIGRMPGTGRTSPPSDSSPMSATGAARRAPARSRAGCRSPSRGRARRRPCAAPPARG